jgi:hypothetical protein
MELAQIILRLFQLAKMQVLHILGSRAAPKPLHPEMVTSTGSRCTFLLYRLLFGYKIEMTAEAAKDMSTAPSTIKLIPAVQGAEGEGQLMFR